MDNGNKRKSTLHGTSFSQDDPALKKVKVDECSNKIDSQSAVNLSDIKVVLDPKIVEKYSENLPDGKKSPIDSRDTVPETSETTNGSVPEKSDSLVKLENSEEAIADNLESVHSFDFIDATTKEELILEQSSDNLENNPIDGTIDDEELAAGYTYNDSIKSEEDPSLRVEVKVEYENGVPEPNGCSSNSNGVTVEQESIHENSMPSFDQQKARSTILLQFQLFEPEVQTKGQVCYQCDHCPYASTKKAHTLAHIKDKHRWIFSRPSFTTSTLGTESFSNQDQFLGRIRFFFQCNYCSASIINKTDMKTHLKNKHRADISGQNFEQIFDDIWNDCVINTGEALEKEGNERKVLTFARRFLKSNKYNSDWIKFIQPYCSKCHLSYDTIKGKTVMYCDACQSRLYFRCRKCMTTRTIVESVWWHMMFSGGDCNISEKLPGFSYRRSSNAIKVKETTSEKTVNKYYHCDKCNYKGASKQQLDFHISSVHSANNSDSTRIFLCSKCDENFNIDDLRSKKHEGHCGFSLPYPCKFCLKTFSSDKFLGYHLERVHVQELKGLKVDVVYTEILVYRQKVREIIETRTLRNFNNTEVEGTIERQSAQHDITILFKPFCLRCKVIVQTDTNKFCPVCTFPLNFQCQQCKETYSNYSTTWDHVTRTCINRIFTFPAKTTTRVNVTSDATKSETLRFPCSHCIYRSATKSALRKHVLRKHVEVGFSCSSCNGWFKSIEEFDTHKPNCQFVGFFQCQFCKHKAPNPDYLKLHLAEEHYSLLRANGVNQLYQKIEKNQRMRRLARSNLKNSTPPISRTTSDSSNLLRLLCLNCNKIVNRHNWKWLKYCAKCSGLLKFECRACAKCYTKWFPALNHVQSNACGVQKWVTHVLRLPPHLVDHSYCRIQTY